MKTETGANDITRKIVHQEAQKLYDGFMMATWDECWNMACDKLHKQFESEGLMTTAETIKEMEKHK